jgi:hypothetical protein
MRIFLAAMLVGALAGWGCAGHRSHASPPAGQPDSAFSELPNTPHANPNPASPVNPKIIVTPESGLTGKVVASNAVGRFVVLNFPVGHLPALEQRLEVYHLGLKVGEVKVTGPQNDDSIVADIVTGDAAAGDEVRDR